MVISIRKYELRGLQSNPRCSVGGRQLPGLEKNDEAENAHHQKTESAQNWARDFSPVLLRLTEGTLQSEHEQSEAGAKKKEVHPGHITREWKPGKKGKSGKAGEAEQQIPPTKASSIAAGSWRSLPGVAEKNV